MTDVLIRAFLPQDQEELMDLIQTNIPEFFAPEEAADYQVYLQEKKEDYFVVETNGTIIGAGGINYFPEEKTARISWDLLHPVWQRKGLGKQLIQHRLNWIRSKKGIEKVMVRTSQHAYLFYEKNGFVLLKTVPDFWAKDFHLYEMEYKLSD